MLRPLCFIFAILIVAVVARQLAIPDTFGEYGHYRGASVEEERDKTPMYVGVDRCAKCHADNVKLHDKDAHTKVQCEVCHGPGLSHSISPANHMKIPKGKDLCLTCHKILDARPSSFPQLDWKEHYKFVGVKNLEVPCTKCHDAHEPLYMDRDIRTARLHPLVHRCRDCHSGKTQDEIMTRPSGHPEIFDCKYCHKAIFTDFKTRPHKKVRCSTCHLFFKQSDFAGRIIRDADPRFCLLCHRAGDFRSEDGPPTIEWPDHRKDMAVKPEDYQKRCIDCHQDRIHIVNREKNNGS